LNVSFLKLDRPACQNFASRQDSSKKDEYDEGNI
jgi:hypothetical protein